MFGRGFHSPMVDWSRTHQSELGCYCSIPSGEDRSCWREVEAGLETLPKHQTPCSLDAIPSPLSISVRNDSHCFTPTAGHFRVLRSMENCAREPRSLEYFRMVVSSCTRPAHDNPAPPRRPDLQRRRYRSSRTVRYEICFPLPIFACFNASASTGVISGSSAR